MFFTIFLNGALGFAMMISILYCIGDVDNALSTPTGWPFIEIFRNATQSNAGATAMTSILIAMIIFATFGYVASASRQLWAFARECIPAIGANNTFADNSSRRPWASVLGHPRDSE